MKLRSKFLLTFSILLIATNAFAATKVTYTVTQGGTYPSLSSAIAQAKTDYSNLVTSDVQIDIVIDGSWSAADTVAVSISGFTTDATRYINIYTTATARHNGIYGGKSTAYRLEVGGFTGSVLGVDNNYITVNGLQIAATFSYGGNTIVWGDNSANYGDYGTITNCLIKIKNTGQYGDMFAGIKCSYVSGFKIYNNIIFSFNNGGSGTGGPIGIYIYNSYGTTHASYAYENTVYFSGNSHDTGMNLAQSSGGTLYAKNNISNGATTDFVFGTNVTHTNNLSKDATGEIQATLSFVAPASYDCHLAYTDTAAIDAGATLGSPYNVDIDGDSRPQGSAYDIGADEYISTTTTYYIMRSIGAGIGVGIK